MGKITQKYNKIREKMTKARTLAVNFYLKEVSNLGDVNRDYVKNSLLLVFAIFLSFFTYATYKSANSIKVAEFNQVNVTVSKRNIELENKIKNQIQGYPIESMTRAIAQQDEQVAAFLIAIAKKESNWGKRTPKLNGEECNNFWGFRQKRDRMGSGGHTCFDNQEEAVELVAGRIKELIDGGFDTPEEMVVWKCGYNCDGHTNESVNKWIDDVGYYYDKF
jgi:hypothetical protein